MYKKIATGFLLSLLFLFACAQSQIVRETKIWKEFGHLKKIINIDRRNILKIKNTRITHNGYFYIIDDTGIMVYHPQTLLIGRNFGSFTFVKDVLKRKHGCYRYFLGEMEYVIFFDRLNNKEFLCLSIPAKNLKNAYDKCNLLSR